MKKRRTKTEFENLFNSLYAPDEAAYIGNSMLDYEGAKRLLAQGKYGTALRRYEPRSFDGHYRSWLQDPGWRPTGSITPRAEQHPPSGQAHQQRSTLPAKPSPEQTAAEHIKSAAEHLYAAAALLGPNFHPDRIVAIANKTASIQTYIEERTYIEAAEEKQSKSKK